MKLHIPEVLPSTLCGHPRICWNSPSSEGCLMAANRAWEGAETVEAARGPAIVLALFANEFANENMNLF